MSNHNRLTILTLLVLFSVGALAQTPSHDRRCDTKPYGATPEEYSAAQLELRSIAASIASDILARDNVEHSGEWELKNAVFLGLRKACYAKFDGSRLALEDFYKAGIDDEQIRSLPTTTIAIRYFHDMGYPPDAQTDVHCDLNDKYAWASREECQQRVDAERQKRADDLAHAQREQAERQARIDNDPRCKSPPFGDTPKAYAETQSALKRAAHGDKTALDVLKDSWHEALVQACQTKLDDADHIPYLRLGIPEADINRLSVTELATSYLDAKQRAITRKFQAEHEDPNTMWAIFQCVQATGECTLQQTPHVEPGASSYSLYFPSLAKCRNHMWLLQTPPDPNTGRSVMAGGAFWYECLSHHVDNWQRAP